MSVAKLRRKPPRTIERHGDRDAEKSFEGVLEVGNKYCFYKNNGCSNAERRARGGTAMCLNLDGLVLASSLAR
eukprot:SAG31_NODE_2294_length_5991_cov_2.589613_9_plen_73_part_00